MEPLLPQKEDGTLQCDGRNGRRRRLMFDSKRGLNYDVCSRPAYRADKEEKDLTDEEAPKK